jgi:hypothetical protein
LSIVVSIEGTDLRTARDDNRTSKATPGSARPRRDRR